MGSTRMKLAVAYQPSIRPSASPYRLLDELGQEIAWANAYLDHLCLLRLSPRSLRAYAYDLLHFARWWFSLSPRPLSEITTTTLFEYVRHQLNQEPRPDPATVNHRLIVVRGLFRFHYQHEIPANSQGDFPRPLKRPSAHLAGSSRRPRAVGPRLRQPRRVVRPLSAEQVARFWRSFRTFRDLAMVGLMLLDGLRSCEVLNLQLEDLQLADGQIRILGKGDKPRVLPLPPEIIDVLDKYLRLERPLTNSPFLFVSLKGRQRGRPLTPAGLRSLFRHHRLRTQVRLANPHRFRHTFGAEMVRAGVSLPALQHLMGHAQIQTTLIYANLAPQDVWRQYAEAVRKRPPLEPPPIL